MPRKPVEDPETLMINDICDRYDGEWVVIKILDASLPMGEAPAQVLAHGADRARMSKELLRAHRGEPTAVLTVLRAGYRFGDGETLRREIARIAADEFVSVNAS